MKKSNRRGFTLIEMMIVVLVIAILALIVGLAVRNAGFRSKSARYIADCAAITNAAVMYRNDVSTTADPTVEVADLIAPTGATGYQGPYLSRVRTPACPFCAPPGPYTIDQATLEAACNASGTHPTS